MTGRLFGIRRDPSGTMVEVLFRQNGENGARGNAGKGVNARVAEGVRRARVYDPEAGVRDRDRERERRGCGMPEREKSTKFISGHSRAEPRPGTNSIASVALFRERAHGTLEDAGRGIGSGG